MKILKLSIITFIIIIFIIACESEQKSIANRSVNTYHRYIDSIEKLDFYALFDNWENLESQAERVRQNAQYSLEKLSDSLELQKKLNIITSRYDILISKVVIEKERFTASNDDNKLYLSLFGSKFVDDQLALYWVNADNILSVYQNFLYNCLKTKKHYNLDDFKTIKLAFFALTDRKNELIKEGLIETEVDKINVINRKFKEICDGTNIAHS